MGSNSHPRTACPPRSTVRHRRVRPGSRCFRGRCRWQRSRRCRTVARLGSTHHSGRPHPGRNRCFRTPGRWGSSQPGGTLPLRCNMPLRRSWLCCSTRQRDRTSHRCSRSHRKPVHPDSTSRCSGTAGRSGSRLCRTPGPPRSSHPAGSSRHQGSRYLRTPRRRGNSPRLCRSLRRCSTRRDRRAPPGNRSSRCRPGPWRSTRCHRPRCARSMSRQRTFHRRSSNRCRSRVPGDSTARRGIRFQRRNMSRRTPGQRGSSPGSCIGARLGSTHPRTGGQVGNMRHRRIGHHPGSTSFHRRGRWDSRLVQRSADPVGSRFHCTRDPPRNSHWPGRRRWTRSTYHRTHVPSRSTHHLYTPRPAGSRRCRTRRRQPRIPGPCRPDSWRSSGRGMLARPGSTLPVCRRARRGSRRRHTGMPRGNTPRQYNAHRQRSTVSRRPLTAGSRLRRGNVCPRRSRLRRTPVAEGSSGHQHRSCQRDSMLRGRRDLRCSSHQPGSADRAGSSESRRSGRPGSTHRPGRSSRSHSRHRRRRRPRGSMRQQRRHALCRSRHCHRPRLPGSSHRACSALTPYNRHRHRHDRRGSTYGQRRFRVRHSRPRRRCRRWLNSVHRRKGHLRCSSGHRSVVGYHSTRHPGSPAPRRSTGCRRPAHPGSRCPRRTLRRSGSTLRGRRAVRGSTPRR